MTLISKAQNPKLWNLISKLTWSGCGCVSPRAIVVSVQTKFTSEQISAMEEPISKLSNTEAEEFGSGDLLIDMTDAEFKAWTLSRNLKDVNTLLNEIYIEGVFREA